MSHVDEGTLHALVDDALDAEERGLVEAHLAACGDCARRFAEATAMARQVHTLLGALDDAGGSARIVAPSKPQIAPEPVAVPGVTPIRPSRFSPRRLAIAASLLVVAGVSYEVGQRRDQSPRSQFETVAVQGTAKPARMVSPPSIVDAPADSYVASPAPSARQRPQGGPRTEAELAASDRAEGSLRRSAVSGAAAAVPATQVPIARPLETAAPALVHDSVDVRRRDAQVSADAAADSRVKMQERAQPSRASQQIAQQNSPRTAQNSSAGDRTEPSSPSQAQSRYGGVVTTGVAAAAKEPSAEGGGAVAKASAPKPVALAGYTATDEESTPSMTRRRYISSSGTPLLLLITTPLPEGKRQRADADASEFSITTSNGRSVVRWHVRGLDYELQGALAPDSLMKLATQLK